MSNGDGVTSQVPYDDLPVREEGAVIDNSQLQFTDTASFDGSLSPPPPLDRRIILLFDLNGTLTSHTSKRYSSGVNLVRPHLEMLLLLKPHFRWVWNAVSGFGEMPCSQSGTHTQCSVLSVWPQARHFHLGHGADGRDRADHAGDRGRSRAWGLV